MKGFKMFDADWKCQGYQFEVGKTYELEGDLVMCQHGFHFCEKLEDCFNYYEAVTWNRIAEVEALGKVITDGNKSCTNKIRIIKALSFNELKSVNGSDGVNRSDGVNGSYGILNSFGVDNALFLANKKRTYGIFGKKVSEQRFNEVYGALQNKLNGWKPTFNNLKSLYVKYGSDWKLTPIPRAEEISKEEAWSSMPKEVVDYVKSLPEYNAEMFFEITGRR